MNKHSNSSDGKSRHFSVRGAARKAGSAVKSEMVERLVPGYIERRRSLLELHTEFVKANVLFVGALKDTEHAVRLVAEMVGNGQDLCWTADVARMAGESEAELERSYKRMETLMRRMERVFRVLDIPLGGNSVCGDVPDSALPKELVEDSRAVFGHAKDMLLKNGFGHLLGVVQLVPVADGVGVEFDRDSIVL